MHVRYRSACNTWCVEASEPTVHIFIPHPRTKGIRFGQDTRVLILISSYLEVPLGVMAFLLPVLCAGGTVYHYTYWRPPGFQALASSGSTP